MNSRLYSGREERWPISADVVLGTGGEGLRGIGECTTASSGGSRAKLSTGSPASLHSSASTYGQPSTPDGNIKTFAFACAHLRFFFHGTLQGFFLYSSKNHLIEEATGQMLVLLRPCLPRASFVEIHLLAKIHEIIAAYISKLS